MIGLLQQTITWYRVEGKLIIILVLGHQNKGKSSFTGSGLFVLMSQCGNNNELAHHHVPCDRLLQKAYCDDFPIISSCSSYTIDLIGKLNVVPNSNPLGIKRFVSDISISFKGECHILMQKKHTKNFNPARFELGTTPS